MTGIEPGSGDLPEIKKRIATPDLISGTILVSVFIAAADEADARLDVFGTTTISMLVVWVSQVFVLFIALEGRRASASVETLRTVKAGIRRSTGLLIAAVPPLLVLALGAVGLIDGAVAYWSSLWIGTLTLGVLGWIAFASRGRRWYWQVCGAAATAGFGLVIIGLRVLIS